MEYEWFNTLEEFVEWELRSNKGSDTRFTKDVVLKIYKELYPDAEVKINITKDFMIDEILKKRSSIDIYEEYKEQSFGIKPSKWINKFVLTPGQCKKMEKEGYLLHVVYYNYEKVFTGTYADVSYYRAEDYFNHTLEEVEKWKENNIRGYIKRKNDRVKEVEILKDMFCGKEITTNKIDEYLRSTYPKNRSNIVWEEKLIIFRDLRLKYAVNLEHKYEINYDTPIKVIDIFRVT